MTVQDVELAGIQLHQTATNKLSVEGNHLRQFSEVGVIFVFFWKMSPEINDCFTHSHQICDLRM